MNQTFSWRCWLNSFSVSAKRRSITARRLHVEILEDRLAPAAISPATFANQSTFVTDQDPVFMLLADVNGDGKPDLISVNKIGDTVSVLLNTTAPGAATPSFAPQQTFATGLHPFSVTLGDINGDGKPDLIVANGGDNTVSVFMNTTAPGAAAASFAAPQIFATGTSPHSVALGDLSGDGKLDLVVANFLDNTVSVLMNTTTPGDSSASFASPQIFATGDGPARVALGDLSGDGKPDLVVANFLGNTVSVLMNTTPPGASSASFAPQQTFATGFEPLSVSLGDANGDGMPDILVANSHLLSPDGGADTVSLLMNTTTPGASTVSFAPQQTFATGNTPLYATFGDVNGDGKPDILVANFWGDSVSVLLNTTAPGAATASFAPQQSIATGTHPSSVVLGDINGEGKLALVVNPDAFTVTVLMNTTLPRTATPAVDSDPAAAVLGGDKPDPTVSALIDATPAGVPAAATQKASVAEIQPLLLAPGEVSAILGNLATVAITEIGVPLGDPFNHPEGEPGFAWTEQVEGYNVTTNLAGSIQPVIVPAVSDISDTNVVIQGDGSLLGDIDAPGDLSSPGNGAGDSASN